MKNLFLLLILFTTYSYAHSEKTCSEDRKYRVYPSIDGEVDRSGYYIEVENTKDTNNINFCDKEDTCLQIGHLNKVEAELKYNQTSNYVWKEAAYTGINSLVGGGLTLLGPDPFTKGVGIAFLAKAATDFKQMQAVSKSTLLLRRIHEENEREHGCRDEYIVFNGQEGLLAVAGAASLTLSLDYGVKGELVSTIGFGDLDYFRESILNDHRDHGKSVEQRNYEQQIYSLSSGSRIE